MAQDQFSFLRFQQDEDSQSPPASEPELTLDFSEETSLADAPQTTPELNIAEADVPSEAVTPEITIARAFSAKGETEAPLSAACEEARQASQELPAVRISMVLRKRLAAVGAALLILTAAMAAFVGIKLATDPYENRILSNVTLMGVDVGGMTRKEAEAALRQATDHTFSRQDMVVSLPHGTVTLTAADTKARVNVRGAVRAAYLYGRWGSKAQRQAALAASRDTEYTVDVKRYLKLDKSFIQDQLSEYAAKYATVLTQYSYRMKGSKPILKEEHFDENAACQTLEITLGTPSLGLSMEQVYNSILDAYSRNQFQVTIADIDPEARPEPVDLNMLLELFQIAPVDAGLDMEKYCPIPGDYGYTFDIEAAQRIIDAADYGETVSIPMEYVEPEIKQNEVYFREVLGECKTPHTTNENRNENLRIACGKINGLILEPGEAFSYNDTLGQRTKENGYKPAPAYSGTALVDSYGGGICQVSSTLYYCALLSDLEILSRINHGFPAGYIDLGMDATVSWGGPDFKFQNSTNFPIKLEAWLENGYVNLRIWGTIEKDYYVEMEYEITGGDNPETAYREFGANEGYYDGQVIEPGTIGYHVNSYRCKYDRETHKLLSREFEAASYYLSTPKVVALVYE